MPNSVLGSWFDFEVAHWESIKLSLTFQELVAALEENPYGGYCLAFVLIGHPVHFVIVAGTLQLRWGLWGGPHVGMNQ